jgi:tetraacyldisaccharide 4'-kinase
VEYVAGFYQSLGKRVAILSRGYRGRGRPNDEAIVLSQSLPRVPHLQGAHRAALAREAARRWQSEVLLLDDGFQHRSLQRDLDIVLIDATQDWGHRFLFPRGLLRESWAALKRAGIVVLTRCDQVSAHQRGRLREAIARFAPTALITEARHRPENLIGHSGKTAPLPWLASRPVLAFCGIGTPESFRDTLEKLECRIEDFRAYPDHHAYSRRDLRGIAHWARQHSSCLLVTTQKDLVKLRQFVCPEVELWALRIRLEITAGERAFEQKLCEAVSIPARHRLAQSA